MVGGTIGRFYKQLLAITLNEDLARTSGVPVTALNLLLTVLTALTTVVAMRMVGVLLVSAMIVIPTLTGFALGRSFRKAVVIAIAMALVSVTLGPDRRLLSPARRGRRRRAHRARHLRARLAGAASGVAGISGGTLMIVIAASLALAGLVLLLSALAGGAHAQRPDCPRWRDVFANMPTRMVTIQVGARSWRCG